MRGMIKVHGGLRSAEDISVKMEMKGRLRRGWGAVYTKAKVGKSEWVTSISRQAFGHIYFAT